MTNVLEQSEHNRQHFHHEGKEFSVMPDHCHLFVQADHMTAPGEIVKTLKSISAVYIFTKFPDLKKRKFWGSGLWSPSKALFSVGHISEEAVKRYIETQKQRG